jgi:hypothetical protein
VARIVDMSDLPYMGRTRQGETVGRMPSSYVHPDSRLATLRDAAQGRHGTHRSAPKVADHVQSAPTNSYADRLAKFGAVGGQYD